MDDRLILDVTAQGLIYLDEFENVRGILRKAGWRTYDMA
jgi:hypothetical protein